MAAVDGRQRLDRTLTLPAFSHKESVNFIVKRHLVRSSLTEAGRDGKLGVDDLGLGGKYFEEVAQHWSSKVWTFLEALRSASAESIAKAAAADDTSGSVREWKLKDQNDRHRVMYREGPVGTPFHTLCLDGVMDGNMTNGLCVGWEVPHYKDWFPQFTVPTFKVTEAKWLRKVRVGEGLSLLRLKVPWPVSPREVVMSTFELEYFEEDLIIVLIESAADADEINEKLHGYSADDLPAPSQNVRMELSGGFVMQKMSSEQFYFRTIADLDMKLDFVPPWIINFVSRQLAGQGLKVYQKTITAVSNGTGSGKPFQQLLKTEALYDRVKSNLDAKVATNGESFLSFPIERLPTFKDSMKTLQGSILRMGSLENYRVVPLPVGVEEEVPDSVPVKEEEENVPVSFPSKVEGETIAVPIHEEVEEEVPVMETPTNSKDELTESPPELHTLANEAAKPEARKRIEHNHPKRDSVVVDEEEAREYDDPEVEWALTVLDKMIAYSRTCGGGRSADTTSNGGKTGISSPGAVMPTTMTEALVNKDKRTPPLKNKTNNNDQTLKASVKTTPRLVKQSPSRLLSSEKPDMSSASSFASAIEFEAAASQDDTDCDPGASSRMSRPFGGSGPDKRSRRRRSRWRWASCFSPGRISSRHHERNKPGYIESGRAAEGYLRPLAVESNSSVKQRGNVTHGDNRYAGPGKDYPPDGDERFVTLGELLMDGAR